jgi:hypothetical protein
LKLLVNENGNDTTNLQLMRQELTSMFETPGLITPGGLDDSNEPKSKEEIKKAKK